MSGRFRGVSIPFALAPVVRPVEDPPNSTIRETILFEPKSEYRPIQSMNDKISEYFEELQKEDGLAVFNLKQWEVLEKIARDFYRDLETQVEKVESDLFDLTNDCRL